MLFWVFFCFLVNMYVCTAGDLVCSYFHFLIFTHLRFTDTIYSFFFKWAFSVVWFMPKTSMYWISVWIYLKYQIKILKSENIWKRNIPSENLIQTWSFWSDALHFHHFDWFLSGLEWILNWVFYTNTFDIVPEIIMEYQI